VCSPVNTTTTIPNCSNRGGTTSRLVTNFALYMQINYTSNLSTVRTHTSAAKHYLHFTKQGLVIENIHKLFQKWKNTYHLLLNLFFYQIKVLTFGTSFFKTEVQSLNWSTSSKIKFIWRYTSVFIFYSPNKLTNAGIAVFNHLKLVGYNSAIVLDTNYHKYTLNYLTRLHYYTIGLIPSTTNHQLVDFAIPISVDSVFSQLFFIRLKLNIRRQALTSTYSKRRSVPYINYKCHLITLRKGYVNQIYPDKKYLVCGRSNQNTQLIITCKY